MNKISRLFSVQRLQKMHQNMIRQFCEKQSQTEGSKEREEKGSDRQTEADEENQQSQYKQKAKNESFKVSRSIFFTYLSLLGYNIYLKSQDQKDSVLDVFPVNSNADYIYSTYRSIYNLMIMPPSDKLLPDQLCIPGLTPIYPKTLVLDLDVLVYTDYEAGKGMLIVKRPGLQNFLDEMRKRYELVVFSNRDTTFIESVCVKLDPNRQYFSGALGSESAVHTMHGIVKDMTYLNRDLSKIVVIEKNPKHVERQSENAIIVDAFNGDKNDVLLKQLSPFLDYLCKNSIRDIRPVIERFGTDQPYKVYYNDIIQKQQSYIEKKKKFSGFKRFYGSDKAI